MLEKIKNLFKSKKTKIIEQAKIDNNNKLFHCHYCHHAFEVTSKMQFPTSVLSVGKEYTFQGIGVQCPKCFKTCIYG